MGAKWNKPDSSEPNNTKCVQKNTVAASFSHENQKGLFTNIHRVIIRTASSRKNKTSSKIGNAKSTFFNGNGTNEFYPQTTTISVHCLWIDTSIKPLIQGERLLASAGLVEIWELDILSLVQPIPVQNSQPVPAKKSNCPFKLTNSSLEYNVHQTRGSGSDERSNSHSV